ncbi:type II toxin-antitoxin system VapC family toxin [Candidatus Acetothermia bacterium]|nr:type II toxin-antitoxin system VapC family toxin [Candidatus Acetothermia bacterium]MBI3660097.1 type II toxin-antitoxin system VapC family toxin [Candidatus Acetothermia bacterium]
MKRFVVDASVAIKWYLPEVLSGQAEQFLEAAAEEDSRLLAPDLIVAELGNILWKKHRLGELAPSEVQQVLGHIRTSFPIQLYASLSLVESAWEIARVYQRSVYDALYVALAEQRDAVFITADQRLVKALSHAPLAKRIQWLGMWGLAESQ